ncbi:MAG TPA: TetR family transcriptional regulator [Streptosporangiaceae bacterium]|jgi:AcrR family transcriptional regulator
MAELRDRKKRETRQRIADLATMLFAMRGFDAVTVADVAEAADVSKMTVFNYFPRKEDLLLDRHEDRLEALRAVVRDRPAGESVVAALRRHNHELLESGHPLSGALPRAAPFFQIVQGSRALQARMLEQDREVEDALAEVLAAEWGDERRARLAATVLAAVHVLIFRTAMRAVLEGHSAAKMRRDQAVLIDRTFDVVAHGLGEGA